MQPNEQSSPKPLRRLLPAVHGSTSARHSGGRSGRSGAISAVAPKRSAIDTACIPCRRRKIRCDGVGPVCSTCARGGLECEWPVVESSRALKRKVEESEDRLRAFEQLFKILQSKEESAAWDVFRRIRGGGDPISVVRHLRDGDLRYQTSLSPENSRRSSLPYSVDMPTLLLQPGNPYLESDVFAWSTEPSRAERNDHTSSHTSAEDYQAQFRIPYHAAELIEPRIDATKPSKWTVVSSDDNLLRALLKAYFQYEYPVYPFFHKDFFLEDMISGKEDHCSRLLVNAILATACRGCSNVINGAAYWHPESLQYRFAAEARRIRDIEVGPDGPDGLTTIQGGLVMSLSYNMNGIDKAGWSYLSNAVNMAQTLKLFDLPPGSIEQKMRAARAFTSWAVFCYQSTFCFHYFQTPLVRHPPRDVMPDPSQAPHWYPETWLLYPPNKNPIRACHAHYIKVVCDFRVILNDIGAAAFPNEKEQKRISVPQTFVFYARLKQWFNNLPVSLTVKRVVLPFQLLVHLHYFNILLSIFEPFLGGSEAIETETVSQPLQIDEETPESIVLHSRIQLETVWRLYYLRHGFDFFDPLLPQFHILLGFMGWRQLSKSNLSRGTTRLTTPEHTQLARSTVVLAAKGLYEHSKNCYLSETMFHIFRDSLDTENLQLLNQFVYMSDNQDEMARGVIAQQVHSQFPVNIVSIAEDPKDHRLDEMIAAYKYLDFEEDN